MSGATRISISLEEALLARFDRMSAAEGYPTRSEAVKTLIRGALVEREWVRGREVAGAVVLVFDHHQKTLVNRMLEVQHKFGNLIIATQHVHLSHHNCLEVVTVKGRGGRIRELVTALKALKGIKHCALVMTTTAKEIG